MGLRFDVLGPLQVKREDQLLEVRAPMQLALLAVLLIDAGEVVTDEQLIEELWRGNPPVSAANTLQSLVLRLRRRLAEDNSQILIRRPSGYQLEMDDAQVDSFRFIELAEQGRQMASRGCAEEASALIVEALSMWRGNAFGDVPSTPAVQAEALRLGEARLATIEQRIDLDLQLGRQAALIGELRRLVLEYPMHEGLWSRLMLSLHREGRRVEALDVYQQVRKMLAQEYGMEPGPGLTQIQMEILEADSR